MCRKSGIFLLVLLVVSYSLWAFPGRATGSGEKEVPIVKVSEENPKEDSGKILESILIAPSVSSAPELEVEELKEILLTDLTAVRENLEVLKAESDRKDQKINDLEAENEKLAKESGSKMYIATEGILGFQDDIPEYGVGLTLGARIGNSLMLQAGVDYMLRSTINDVINPSRNNISVRAGIGWMF